MYIVSRCFNNFHIFVSYSRFFNSRVYEWFHCSDVTIDCYSRLFGVYSELCYFLLFDNESPVIISFLLQLLRYVITCIIMLWQVLINCWLFWTFASYRPVWRLFLLSEARPRLKTGDSMGYDRGDIRGMLSVSSPFHGLSGHRLSKKVEILRPNMCVLA